MIVRVLLGLALVWTIVSILVWSDAKRYSDDSAFLWGLAVFVGGLLGLILYFILGRQKTYRAESAGETALSTGLVKCSNCGSVEERDRDVCRFCETELLA